MEFNFPGRMNLGKVLRISSVPSITSSTRFFFFRTHASSHSSSGPVKYHPDRIPRPLALLLVVSSGPVVFMIVFQIIVSKSLH